ncbi:MAG: DUF1080 domain-containing protein [Verrucomicrobia bacterium]|nr:DUF1080 domain-containing protein [Verrucomicrobiota bacterium]
MTLRAFLRPLFSVPRLLAAVLCPLFSGVSRADPPGLQPIFDGRTLAGWEGNLQLWRVEAGAITAEIPAGQPLKKNEFIYWQGEVHDFELVAEFRISGVPGANSGIQFRSQRLPDGLAAGYQADLDDGATWLGRIYDEHGRALLVERGTRVAIAPDGRRWADEFAKPADFRALTKPGEWSTYRITASASHVEVWINGTLCSVLDDREAAAADFSGRLALQMHSGPGPAKIQFRNIRLAQLGRTAQPPRTAPPPASAAPGVSAALFASIAPAGADGRPLNLSFETGTLAGWTVEGDAWAAQPVRFSEPATPRRKSDVPSDPVGGYWIGPVPRAGNRGTGRLTSPAFTVTHRWASYLVGGGKDATKTRVELIDAATGAVVHASAGANSDILRREVVDLGSASGKSISIRLVDEASAGPWNHIDFDDFVFHDRQPDFSGAVAASAGRQHQSPVLWHLQPNPARPTAVANTAAQKLVAGMALTAGFQAELIAAEPDVRQPVAFAIDDRGRLWVAEAFSYPLKRPEGQGKDRILIFEDQNGDGTFETRKVFTEGLNLVSGLEVGFGGVWVGAAPHLLFIPDRNLDDVPDGPPVVLLDGWGLQDTHETLNSFTWGPDGWLYGCHGVFTHSLVGKPGAAAAQRAKIRAGVWRYHPVRHEFEVFSHGGSNQWGIDFNEVGHLFITHCRSFHGGGGTTFAIRNGHYWNQANNDYAPFVSNRGTDFAPGLKNFLPSSARYDSGEGGAGKPGTTAVYGGHSHVGTMIYLGDNFPDTYRDRLFTHNLHGHQINQQQNVRQGSGYETFHAGFDLLFAPDSTYVPVDLQYGPDGAVYAIDWADLQHCHNPRDELWDRTSGRIYRISWAGTYRPVAVNLGAKTDRELVALHTHRSEWFVRTARRLLQERAATRPIAAAALGALREQSAGAKETSAYLRAFWTLHTVGALDRAALTAALRHPADVVRAWAVQLATERPLAPAVEPAALARLAAEDPSPAVRLALASALPALPAGAGWPLVAALAAHGEDAADRFLPKMIWFGLAGLASGEPARALDLAASTPLSTLADSVLWFAARNPAGREQIVARLAGSAPGAPNALSAAAALRGLRVLAFALEGEAAIAMPPAWPQVLARFATVPDAAARAAVEQLSALFGDKDVLARTRDRLADSRASLAQRRAALALLKRAGDPEALPIYVRLLDEDAFRADVIPLLSGTDDPAAAAGLIRHFGRLADVDRAAALGTLTSRAALAVPLLEAVGAGALDKKHLTALHARQLRSLRDERVDRLLDRVWGRATDSSADAKATVSRLKNAYTEAPLWSYSSAAGKQVFQRLCASCHMIDGEGGKLGPDLAGSERNGLDYFLENIVDPNAVVGTEFQLNLVTKHDGAVVSGMIERETDTVLVVRTVTETVNVPKSQLKDRQVLPQSLMPPGLLEAISEREALELLKYLLDRR